MSEETKQTTEAKNENTNNTTSNTAATKETPWWATTLKWTGIIAGAAAVGAGAYYGMKYLDNRSK